MPGLWVALIMKRRRRTNRTTPAKGRLRDMADQLWSLSVRADWEDRCAVCGAGRCEAHHLVPRQFEATRYDSWNGIALCPTHHKFDKELSPHQNAAGWLRWLKDHYPLRAAWYLSNCRPAAMPSVRNAAYYLEVIRDLRQYVEPVEFERVVGVRLAERLEE